MRRCKRPCQDRSSFAVMLTAIVIWLCPMAGGRAADCVLQRAAELPIADNSRLSPIVTIPIDDQPRRVLLDTGGFVNMINNSVVGDEKVSPADNVIYLGLYGTPLRDYYRIQSVKVGIVNFKDVDFYAAPRSEDLDATLGANYLRSFDIEIDPIKNTASFFLKNSCGDKVVYWPHDDISEIPLNIDLRNKHINVTVVLNGKEIPAILDTGASESYLDATTARRLFGVDENTPGMKRIVPKSKLKDERYETFRYRFQTLSLGNVTFKNPAIQLAHMSDGGPQFILGMQELHGMHLFFAYGQAKLYMTTSRGDLAAMQADQTAGAQAQLRHPDPMEQLNARGYMLNASDDLEADELDDATSAADAALRLDPTLGYAHLMKAEIAFKRGNMSLGMEEGKIATRDHAEDAGIYRRRILLYSEYGMPERCVR